MSVWSDVIFLLLLLLLLLLKVSDFKSYVAFLNLPMYFTLHRVHLTKSLATEENCKKMYERIMEKHTLISHNSEITCLML